MYRLDVRELQPAHETENCYELEDNWTYDEQFLRLGFTQNVLIQWTR